MINVMAVAKSDVMFFFMTIIGKQEDQYSLSAHERILDYFHQ